MALLILPFLYQHFAELVKMEQQEAGYARGDFILAIARSILWQRRTGIGVQVLAAFLVCHREDNTLI